MGHEQPTEPLYRITGAASAEERARYERTTGGRLSRNDASRPVKSGSVGDLPALPGLEPESPPLAKRRDARFTTAGSLVIIAALALGTSGICGCGQTSDLPIIHPTPVAKIEDWTLPGATVYEVEIEGQPYLATRVEGGYTLCPKTKPQAESAP